MVARSRRVCPSGRNRGRVPRAPSPTPLRVRLRVRARRDRGAPAGARAGGRSPGCVRAAAPRRCARGADDRRLRARPPDPRGVQPRGRGGASAGRAGLHRGLRRALRRDGGRLHGCEGGGRAHGRPAAHLQPQRRQPVRRLRRPDGPRGRSQRPRRDRRRGGHRRRRQARHALRDRARPEARRPRRRAQAPGSSTATPSSTGCCPPRARHRRPWISPSSWPTSASPPASRGWGTTTRRPTRPTTAEALRWCAGPRVRWHRRIRHPGLKEISLRRPRVARPRPASPRLRGSGAALAGFVRPAVHGLPRPRTPSRAPIG